MKLLIADLRLSYLHLLSQDMFHLAKVQHAARVSIIALKKLEPRTAKRDVGLHLMLHFLAHKVDHLQASLGREFLVMIDMGSRFALHLFYFYRDGLQTLHCL